MGELYPTVIVIECGFKRGFQIQTVAVGFHWYIESWCTLFGVISLVFVHLLYMINPYLVVFIRVFSEETLFTAKYFTKKTRSFDRVKEKEPDWGSRFRVDPQIQREARAYAGLQRNHKRSSSHLEKNNLQV